MIVDAFGSRDEQRKISVTDPKQGQRLKLTLDFDLQKAGDAALEQAISNSEYQTNAGAWIAMDPRDGAILGMGSKPGFDASVFAKPITQKTYEYLTSDDTGAPLLNRVTESGYPDRLDLQAGDGAGGARRGPDQPAHHDHRHRPPEDRHAGVPERQGGQLRHDQRVGRAEGLLGHLLLPARRLGQRPRAA